LIQLIGRHEWLMADGPPASSFRLPARRLNAALLEDDALSSEPGKINRKHRPEAGSQKLFSPKAVS
jgi:hypothetical protein